MKKSDLAEIKKMDIKSLDEKVKKSKKELLELMLEKSTSKLTNLKVIKNKRREIAQVLTVLRQKQLLSEMEGV